MKVREIMRPIVSVDSASTAYDAAQLMLKYYSSCILVENNKTAIGIITESDFMRVVTKERASPSEIKVYQMMSKPLKTIQPDSTLEDAARMMVKERIRRLPVLEQEHFIGIINAADFLDSMFKPEMVSKPHENRAENIAMNLDDNHKLIAEPRKVQ